MRPITVTVGPLVAASANNIALSQTPLTAGALTLNGSTATGGVATLDVPRQVLFTFAANETGHNFIVTGTSGTNDVISETVAGTTAGTKATVLSYKTVTSITISAAATGALTVGTNGVADSPWVRLDPWSNSYVSIQCTASGTVNYTVQQTLDDPNSPTNPVLPSAMTWVNSNDTAAVGATGSIQTNYGFTPTWARVLLNSGTGTVVSTFAQTGVVNL